MNNLEQITKEYLNYCQYQKCLDSKTLKAYRIDLAQFISKVERRNHSSRYGMLHPAFTRNISTQNCQT